MITKNLFKVTATFNSHRKTCAHAIFGVVRFCFSIVTHNDISLKLKNMKAQKHFPDFPQCDFDYFSRIEHNISENRMLTVQCRRDMC